MTQNQTSTGARPHKTVIQNVRIFDGCGLTKPQTVAIDGGVIGSNKEGADEIVNGNGEVLMPGFIDAHVHLRHEGHLRHLAELGVTTALDMGTWPADKMNSLDDKAGQTDIKSAGLPATAAGSIHSFMLPLPQEALLAGPLALAERYPSTLARAGQLQVVRAIRQYIQYITTWITARVSGAAGTELNSLIHLGPRLDYDRDQPQMPEMDLEGMALSRGMSLWRSTVRYISEQEEAQHRGGVRGKIRGALRYKCIYE